jgi:hypothetical protein
MHPELVVLYIVAGAFTAALAGLTMPPRRSSLPRRPIFLCPSVCCGHCFFDRYFQLLAKQRSVGHLPTWAATIRRHEHDFRS